MHKIKITESVAAKSFKRKFDFELFRFSLVLTTLKINVNQVNIMENIHNVIKELSIITRLDLREISYLEMWIYCCRKLLKVIELQLPISLIISKTKDNNNDCMVG